MHHEFYKLVYCLYGDYLNIIGRVVKGCCLRIRRPGFKSGSKQSYLFLHFGMYHEFCKLVSCVIGDYLSIIGRVVKETQCLPNTEGQGSNPGQD